MLTTKELSVSFAFFPGNDHFGSPHEIAHVVTGYKVLVFMKGLLFFCSIICNAFYLQKAYVSMSVAQKFSRPKLSNVSCTFLTKIEHLFLSLDLSVQLMIQLNASNCSQC